MYQCSIHGWISMFESCPKCATPVVSVATTNTNYVVETPTPGKKLTPMGEMYAKFNSDNTVNELFEWIYDNKERLLEAEREMADDLYISGCNAGLGITGKKMIQTAKDYFTQNYRQQ